MCTLVQYTVVHSISCWPLCIEHIQRNEIEHEELLLDVEGVNTAEAHHMVVHMPLQCDAEGVF